MGTHHGFVAKGTFLPPQRGFSVELENSIRHDVATARQIRRCRGEQGRLGAVRGGTKSETNQGSHDRMVEAPSTAVRSAGQHVRAREPRRNGHAAQPASGSVGKPLKVRGEVEIRPLRLEVGENRVEAALGVEVREIEARETLSFAADGHDARPLGGKQVRKEQARQGECT
jgi:hypothetical protein